MKRPRRASAVFGRHPRAGIVAAACVLFTAAAPAVTVAQTAPEPQERAEAEPDANAAITLRAFGSVLWGATQQHEGVNSFTLGQFALFATSSLTERISVLAEVVMEGSTQTRVVTDLERLQLTYRVDDRLQLTAGRYHSGIGFYNAAFHHGAYFETPIDRPAAFAFEDEGGVLPVHEVGLSARGEVPGTRSALHYLAEIGNGRAWEPEESSGHEGPRDVNNAKSVNLGLTFHPARWTGLELGVTHYRDSIARDGLDAVAHAITAAYFIYRTPSTELMAEWLRLEHEADEADVRNDIGYLQVARRVAAVKPYYRYDRVSVDPRTPLIGGTNRYVGHTFGVRWEVSQWVGLKAQYERADRAGERNVDAFRTQLVFVF